MRPKWENIKPNCHFQRFWRFFDDVNGQTYGRTNIRTGIRTGIRTDTPSFRDAGTHLKTRLRGRRRCRGESPKKGWESVSYEVFSAIRPKHKSRSKIADFGKHVVRKEDYWERRNGEVDGRRRRIRGRRRRIRGRIRR